MKNLERHETEEGFREFKQDGQEEKERLIEKNKEFCNVLAHYLQENGAIWASMWVRRASDGNLGPQNILQRAYRSNVYDFMIVKMEEGINYIQRGIQ